MLRLSLHVVLLTPFVLSLLGAFKGNLGVEPVGFLSRGYGSVAVVLFVLNLYIGAVNRFWNVPLIKRLARYRRDIGLSTAFYAALHTLSIVFYAGGIGKTKELIIEESFVKFGLLSWITIIALALTSNDFSVRWLRKKWKTLHRLVYLALISLFLHCILNHEGNREFAYICFLPMLLIQLIRYFRYLNNRFFLRNISFQFISFFGGNPRLKRNQ